MAAGDKQSAMLQQLLSFPPALSSGKALSDREYDAGIRSVANSLLSIPAARLVTADSERGGILETVDPAVHSLPYEYALVATARAQSADGAILPDTPLYSAALKFLAKFDPIQVRYGGHQFRELLSMMLRGAAKGGSCAARSLGHVVIALGRLDPSGSTLTSTHVEVFELCLRLKAFGWAQPLLDRDIFHLPSPLGQESQYPLLCSEQMTSAGYINEQTGLSARLSYQDYLKYFLYGASLHIARKNWKRALHFLEIVLAAPVAGQSFSMIQVEAYKKWCLVHLLVAGKAGYPRNMTQPAAKHCQNLAKAYVEIGEKFKQPATEKLEAEVEEGPFEDDCNYGLVMFVVAAHRRLKVSNLALTYTSLSVKDVAKAIGNTSSEDTENYLQSLIDGKEIDATLSSEPADPGERLLIFSKPQADDKRWHDLAEAQVHAANRLATTKQHMTDTQRRVESSDQYLVALKRQRRMEANGKGDGRGMPDDDDAFEDI